MPKKFKKKHNKIIKPKKKIILDTALWWSITFFFLSPHVKLRIHYSKHLSGARVSGKASSVARLILESAGLFPYRVCLNL